MRLHDEVVLVTLLRLAHIWGTFAVLVLGRIWRINQRDIDDGALAQRQASITQITIGYRQSPSRQILRLQQIPKVEDSGLVGGGIYAPESAYGTGVEMELSYSASPSL